MKKNFFVLLAMLATGSLTAEPLIDNTFFSMDNIPIILTADVRLGSDVEFKLEENSSEGLVWNAVYDPRECKVQIAHKASKIGRTDAKGYADIELKPLKPGVCTVVLNYASPFKQTEKPKMSVKCTLTTVKPATKQAPPSEPVTIPGNLQTLRDDVYYRLRSLPPAMQIQLQVGKDIEFELQENPAKGESWAIVKPVPANCRVKVEHDAESGLFKTPKAEIEIKALAAGTSFVDFQYKTGTAQLKTFRVYFTFTAQ